MQGGREKDEWKMTVGESLSHLVKSGVLLRSGKQGGEEWEERELINQGGQTQLCSRRQATLQSS